MKNTDLREAIDRCDDCFVTEALADMEWRRKLGWKRVLYGSGMYLSGRRIAAAILLVFTLSCVGVSAAAAVFPTFAAFLQAVFVGRKQSAQITRIDLQQLNGTENHFENGLFIEWTDAEDTAVKQVWRVQEGTLVRCEKQSCMLSLEIQGERIAFPLYYAAADGQIRMYPDANTQKYDISLYETLYDEQTAIVMLNNYELKSGVHLTTACYLDLKTGETRPIADMQTTQQAIQTVQSGVYPADTVIHVIMPEKLSADRRFILYRGDTEEICAGVQLEDKPTWHVYDTKLQESLCLKESAVELFSKDFCFVDNTHLAAVLRVSSREIPQEDDSIYTEEIFEIGLYDLESGALKRLPLTDQSNVNPSCISVSRTEQGYQIQDAYTEKQYSIPAVADWQEAWRHISREVICIGGQDGSCKVLWLPENQVIDFTGLEFSDVAEVTDIFCYAADTYLIEAIGRDGTQILESMHWESD